MTRAPKPRYRITTLDDFGDVLTAEDMALYFHKGVDAVNTMCRKGQLEGAYKIGRTWQCHKDNIKKHMKIA